MNNRPTRQRCLILVAAIACAMLLFANDAILAQEVDQPKPSEVTDQQSPDPDGQEPIKGYPETTRRIGTPSDVEWDLDNSFPKSGSVLELILQCREKDDQ